MFIPIFLWPRSAKRREILFLLKYVLFKWNLEFSFGDDSEPSSGDRRTRPKRLLRARLLLEGESESWSPVAAAAGTFPHAHARVSWGRHLEPVRPVRRRTEKAASWKCRARAVWKECHKSFLFFLLLSVLDMWSWFYRWWLAERSGASWKYRFGTYFLRAHGNATRGSLRKHPCLSERCYD